MNLYYITIWDPKGKTGDVVTGASTYLAVVAKNAGTAWDYARGYRGEVTSLKLAQSDIQVA